MGLGLDEFQTRAAVWTGGLLLLIAVCWALWHRVAARREAHRRIEAARVRSGHVPLEIPTVRGNLGSGQEDGAPDTLPEWFIQGKGEHAVVDEHPRIHLRYRDPQGRKAECTMKVEKIDLRKRYLAGYGDLPGEQHVVPLHAIKAARIADTGQRFNVDFWVDAVKVARRRRGEA
ncbi:hypothetical protein [Variovorax sp. ZT4R33]|uniref:hypothetical protein n=1 Tax=Variovorax sp. ZT4R33 TaxID=3443743 RepID=UPI003F48044F